MPPSARQAVQRPEYGDTDEPIARWIESLAASPRIASPPRAGRINLDELARSTDEQGRLKRATIISFTPGKPIYVDAWINDSARARLLLGTGADHTLIAPRLLSAAGVSLRAPRTTAEIRGVTGSITAHSYALESLRVGDARVGALTIIAHDMADANGDGLLGRDFLDQFTVTIDNAAGRVTLSPK